YWILAVSKFEIEVVGGRHKPETKHDIEDPVRAKGIRWDRGIETKTDGEFQDEERKKPPPKFGETTRCIDGEQEDAADNKRLGDRGEPYVDDRITLADAVGLHGTCEQEVESRVGEDCDL